MIILFSFYLALNSNRYQRVRVTNFEQKNVCSFTHCFAYLSTSCLNGCSDWKHGNKKKSSCLRQSCYSQCHSLHALWLYNRTYHGCSWNSSIKTSCGMRPRQNAVTSCPNRLPMLIWKITTFYENENVIIWFINILQFFLWKIKINRLIFVSFMLWNYEMKINLSPLVVYFHWLKTNWHTNTKSF